MGMALRRRRAHRTLRVVFMKCYLVVFPILGQCRAGCYTLRSDSRADHPILYNAMAVPGLPPGETVENRPLGRTVSGGGGTVRPSAVRVGGWGAVRARPTWGQRKEPGAMPGSRKEDRSGALYCPGGRLPWP